MTKSNASTTFTPFAWHGIECEVPEAWELARYDGGYDAGYASLDDGVDTRFHCRWNRVRKRPKLLEGALKRYERSLRKAAKGTFQFEAGHAAFVPKPQREGRDLAAFRWEADTAAQGLAWYSHATGRLVMAEVLFRESGVDKALARRVLKSGRDHRDDGRRLWAVYGFTFLAPDHYTLEQAELAPGRLRFELRAASHLWLRVERWAMASQCLHKASLEQWPRELVKLLGLAPRGALEQHETRVHTHRACRFKQTVGRGRLGRRQRVAGLVWTCPEDDKIVVVMAGGGVVDLPEDIAATVVCR